jgi:hypothetical protein
MYSRSRTKTNSYSFINVRQAPIIDESQLTELLNPLGIREIVVVNYTEKAFGKEGLEMMEYSVRRTGWLRMIRRSLGSLDDIQYLFKHEFIALDHQEFRDNSRLEGNTL